MPLTSRNITRKLSKGVKGTSTIVGNLKQQHAEELDTANEEHAKKIAQLASEVDECRAEIDSLRQSSDEHYDTLMPLPSPSKSLKFVRNTTSSRKQRALKAAAGGGDDGNSDNTKSMIADMKMQHRKDLAQAASIYAKKLHSMKKKIVKYETEALKASTANMGRSEHEGDDTNVNEVTGVADKDKENVSQKQKLSHRVQSSKPKNNGREAVHNKEKKTKRSQELIAAKNRANLQHQNEDTTKDFKGLDDKSVDLKDQYERLFMEELPSEKDTAYEEAIALSTSVMENAVDYEEIGGFCKELVAFMADVRSKSLS